MTKRASLPVLLGLVILPAAVVLRGGWAVTTVDTFPEYVVAGEPFRLSYTVRQHGMTLLSGLAGTVRATAGAEGAEGSLAPVASTASPGKPGRYTAVIVLPKPGEWSLTIHSGFGGSESALPPVRVINRGEAPPTLRSPFELGRRLFAAKGCMQCHVHGEVAGSGPIQVGPDLTNLRFATDYLASFLADPSIKPRTMQATMPNLGLTKPEIESLVSFVNAQRRVATR
ncbi:MAG TPA: hypothetical protein VHE78_17425 [Gemmatimonadaceae bacterium]|nr:hypothetical protein [Gemmatimonadaceae bacterium]